MIAVIVVSAIVTGCGGRPKAIRVISGEITEIHGKYSRANDFKILVDTCGGVIHTVSDNTFWDFDGARKGDSVFVTIYSDGSACAHTYRMRSDMVQGADDDIIKLLKGKRASLY